MTTPFSQSNVKIPSNKMQMQRLLVRSMGLFSKKKPPPPKEKECPPRDCGKRPGGLFKFFKSRKYETKDLSEKTTDKEELVCRKQYRESLFPNQRNQLK